MTPSTHPSKLSKPPKPPRDLNIVQYLKTSVIRAYYSCYHPNMKVNKFCRFFSPWVVYHGNGWFSLSIMTIMDGWGIFDILRLKIIQLTSYQTSRLFPWLLLMIMRQKTGTLVRLKMRLYLNYNWICPRNWVFSSLSSYWIPFDKKHLRMQTCLPFSVIER